ncbi:hypothetical protein FACS1894187_05070 [Synergistales bacterium]|nr:hypothetical protein FACS1894187_05070 [Synergistales bacterium]
MSVFLLCERALSLINAPDMRDLDAGAAAALEACDEAGLVNMRAQKEAIVCARSFAVTRDKLLTLHPWVFARKNASLARMTVNTNMAGWKYAFALPVDCLKALSVTKTKTALDISDDGQRSFWSHYEIIGRALASNASAVWLLYTARITDTGLWDSVFADAFTALLAGAIAANVGAQNALNVAAAMEQKAAAIAQAGYMTGVIERPDNLPFNLPEYMDYSGPWTYSKAPAWEPYL